LLLGIEDLLLERFRLGEVNGDFVGGQLVVDLVDGIDFVLNLFFVEGVDEDSNVLLSVKGHSG
jgi:hypothetical protein